METGQRPERFSTDPQLCICNLQEILSLIFRQVKRIEVSGSTLAVGEGAADPPEYNAESRFFEKLVFDRQIFQNLFQLLDIDRFGQIPVHARIEAFILVAGHGIGCQSDYRYVSDLSEIM